MLVSAEHDPRRTGTIWASTLNDPPPVITPLLPVTFRQVGPESAPSLAEAMAGMTPEAIMKRLEAGRQCYIASVGNDVAAYAWVSFDEEYVSEFNLRIRLLPGEAYIWNCLTLPGFREQRLYSGLLAYISSQLRTQEVCRIWICTDLENVPSQRGIERAGFHHVADLIVSRVLAMRFVYVQGQPEVPDSLVSETRRVFLDNRDNVWLSALSSVQS
jgi:Acetyltransferase (GNAT) family